MSTATQEASHCIIAGNDPIHCLGRSVLDRALEYWSKTGLVHLKSVLFIALRLDILLQVLLHVGNQPRVPLDYEFGGKRIKKGMYGGEKEDQN